MERTAIINALVFDGYSLHKNASVIIEDGFIGSIGSSVDTSNAKIIDGTGLTLLPGFIDAHIHLANDNNKSPKLLLQLAKYGVTTAMDMGLLAGPVRQSFRSLSGSSDVPLRRQFRHKHQ